MSKVAEEISIAEKPEASQPTEKPVVVEKEVPTGKNNNNINSSITYIIIRSC